MRAHLAVFLFLLLATEGSLICQIGTGGRYPGGGYPGGGYPGGGYPGGYPGGGGVGFPRPGGRGKKKTTKGKEAQEPLINVTGVLRKIDDKNVVVEAQDNRILTLKRSEQTKFFKSSEEVKPTDLKPGDHLLIESTQDIEGYYSAVNVIFQKDGTAQERAAASEPVEASTQASELTDEVPVLRRKDSPPRAPENTPPETSAPSEKQEASPQGVPSRPAASSAATIPIDEGDEGPPRLKRGVPKKRKTTEVAPVEPPRNIPAAPRNVPEPENLSAKVEPPSETVEIVPPAAPTADPVIEKARAVAESFSETLPNYLCQQFTARFVNTSHITSWQALDVVSAEVVYENGRESYRNLAINGKPTKKNMEELSGSWSKGEFGTMLMDLFSASTAAEFQYRKESVIAGLPALRYDFTVERENSHWHIQVPSQSIQPAYKGSVWIEKKTSRVLRIEMQSRQMPEEFPNDKVESATDYEYVRLGTAQFLLPVHAETMSCQRGTNVCSRNTIDFRNYHKYSGESTVTFGSADTKK